MSISSIVSVSSLTFAPDLAPLQPKPADLRPLLADPAHLAAPQKRALAAHALRHALLFADLALLIFLLHDPHAAPVLDLGSTDEDERGVLSVAMMGFGTGDPEREMDREECCRMLLASGADMVTGDHAGWTPFHYAALMAPPTLITYMLAHCATIGSSPAVLLDARTTRSGLTPLDVITAHSPMPGREGIALMLEEAMGVGALKERMKREQREAAQRRHEERKVWAEERRRCLMTWGLGGWGEDAEEGEEDGPEDDASMWDSDEEEDELPVAEPTWDSMLAFSLPSLQGFLLHLIDNQKPVLNPASRRSLPAHALWLCGRFAIAQANEDWFDEVLLGGLSRIEDIILNTNDVPILSFWAYNVTLLMYLLRTDKLVSGWAEDFEHVGVALELLDYIYNGIVRSVEHKVAPIIDAAMLDFTPLGPAEGFDAPQFEGEWTFLKGVRDTLRLKKPSSNSNSPSKSPVPPKSPIPPPPPPKDSLSTPKSVSLSDLAAQAGGNLSSASAEPKVFAELRKVISRPPSPFGSQSPSKDDAETDSPKTLNTMFSSLLLVLRLYGLNPAYIVQVFSQIFVWMHADMFNKVLSRNKYLCRSRAMQIRMNISTLEDWTSREGLPRSLVSKHFEPLNQLLQWLQCCSQIDQFSNLIATVQTLRRINPLQMRKAVRDYRYEVGESHMNEECNQYLAQLQRDWERRRLRLGVETMRKEMEAREREREQAGGSENGLALPASDSGSVLNGHPAPADGRTEPQRGQDNIDALFDAEMTMADWVPPEAPMAVGELQNPTYILPVFWPSDVRHLVAEPADSSMPALPSARSHSRSANLAVPNNRPASVASMASVVSTRSSRQLEWKRRPARALRETWPDLPQWVDSLSPGVYWEDYRGNKYVKAAAIDSEEEEENEVEQVEFDLLRERESTLATVGRGMGTIRGLHGLGLELTNNLHEHEHEHEHADGLPDEEDVPHLQPPTSHARSSGESSMSLRTPDPSSSDPSSAAPAPANTIPLNTPPHSPIGASPPPSDNERVDLLRRTSSSKVTVRRKLRRKRREGSEMTIRPGDDGEGDGRTPLADTHPRSAGSRKSSFPFPASPRG